MKAKSTCSLAQLLCVQRLVLLVVLLRGRERFQIVEGHMQRLCMRWEWGHCEVNPEKVVGHAPPCVPSSAALLFFVA